MKKYRVETVEGYKTVADLRISLEVFEKMNKEDFVDVCEKVIVDANIANKPHVVNSTKTNEEVIVVFKEKTTLFKVVRE